MRITIEPDLPSEPSLKREVVEHVSAYVLGYKVGNIVMPGEHQPVFAKFKGFGVPLESVRTGLGEMADMVLLQLIRKSAPAP
jgi:hypothetical protein